jgi:acyl carrier protein
MAQAWLFFRPCGFQPSDLQSKLAAASRQVAGTAISPLSLMVHRAAIAQPEAKQSMSIDPQSILDIVAEEALVDREKLTPDATLESLGIASLDIISIVFALEEKFGVVLEQSDFEGVTTVGGLVELIVSKSNEAAKPA